MVDGMLQETWTLPRSSRDAPRTADGRLEAEAPVINPWLRWRPSRPAAVQVLSVAELAECTCPDLCDRDHRND